MNSVGQYWRGGVGVLGPRRFQQADGQQHGDNDHDCATACERHRNPRNPAAPASRLMRLPNDLLRCERLAPTSPRSTSHARCDPRSSARFPPSWASSQGCARRPHLPEPTHYGAGRTLEKPWATLQETGQGIGRSAKGPTTLRNRRTSGSDRSLPRVPRFPKHGPDRCQLQQELPRGYPYRAGPRVCPRDRLRRGLGLVGGDVRVADGHRARVGENG